MKNLRRGLLSGAIEVKAWRASRYQTVFVETACYSRRTGAYEPSGLSTTTADAWAFVGLDDGDRVVSSFIIPTDRLRKLAADRQVLDAARNSKNPSRGIVLAVSELVCA